METLRPKLRCTRCGSFCGPTSGQSHTSAVRCLVIVAVDPGMSEASHSAQPSALQLRTSFAITLTLQSLLFSIPLLCFPIYLAFFLCVFPSVSKDFRGSAKKNPCFFFPGFPCFLFQKSKGWRTRAGPTVGCTRITHTHTLKLCWN